VPGRLARFCQATACSYTGGTAVLGLIHK
jgi:hypothetical protein